jgi:hypothetical protein
VKPHAKRSTPLKAELDPNWNKQGQILAAQKLLREVAALAVGAGFEAFFSGPDSRGTMCKIQHGPQKVAIFWAAPDGTIKYAKSELTNLPEMKGLVFNRETTRFDNGVDLVVDELVKMIRQP